MANTIDVTAETFGHEVLESEVPVLVDFWAEWCEPCKQLSPVMEEIADEYEGAVKVVRVDVDNESEVAQHFEIESVPTVALFVPGEQPTAVIGALPKETLESMFELERFSGGR
ncbi:MAG: thioredoxin [Rubrobacter sp.]|nr:thioredoxin [Rubrobacter sp.]